MELIGIMVFTAGVFLLYLPAALAVIGSAFVTADMPTILAIVLVFLVGIVAISLTAYFGGTYLIWLEGRFL